MNLFCSFEKFALIQDKYAILDPGKDFPDQFLSCSHYDEKLIVFI